MCAMMSSDLSVIRVCKQKFHRGRYLKVKHLPPDVHEEEIRALLSLLHVNSVDVNYTLRTATVTLHSPEVLDHWPSDQAWKLRDAAVEIGPSATESTLCVAHLPIEYSDKEFEELVQPYGTVSSCFLVRSERTGESKGYGVVTYTSREVSQQARNLLDRKKIEKCTVHCNWLEPGHMTYSSLHSKCLYVDNLPLDYTDVADFRLMFSVVASPPYCQIAVKRGQPLGFGLVEFSNAEEAEVTRRKLNHVVFRDREIRVGFCIPGYRAVTVYNRLVSNVSSSKKPLLPDPPVGASLMQKLPWQAARNPQFAHAVRALTLQLQEATRKKDQNFPNGAGKADSVDKRKNGMLGKGPEDPSSLQAALVVLLASQLQMQMGVRQNPNSSQSPENGRGRAKNGNNRSVPIRSSDSRPWRLKDREPSSGNGGGNCNANSNKLPERRDDDRGHRKGTKNGARAPLLPDPVPVLGRGREGCLLPHPIHAGNFCSEPNNPQDMPVDSGRTTTPPSTPNGRAGLLGDKPLPHLTRDSPPTNMLNPEEPSISPNLLNPKPVEQPVNGNANMQAMKDLQALKNMLPFLPAMNPQRPNPPTIPGIGAMPAQFINHGPNMIALAQLQLQMSVQNQRVLAQNANSAAMGFLLQLALGGGPKASPVVNGFPCPAPSPPGGTAVRPVEGPDGGLNFAPWWVNAFGMTNNLPPMARIPQAPPPHTLPGLVDPVGGAFTEAGLGFGFNAEMNGKSSLLGDFWQASLHNGNGIPNVPVALKRKMQTQLPLAGGGNNPIFIGQPTQELSHCFKKKRL